MPSAPERWATDSAGFLSAEALAALNTALEEFEAKTGRQIIVYIGKTTGGVPIEEWSSKTFQAWGVGRKGLDNGLALFLMAEDRKVRLEVGYGLESVVTDAVAARLINDVIIPRLRSGQNDAAVTAGVAFLFQTITGPSGGEPGPDASAGRTSGKPSSLNGILIIIAIIVFLVLFLTNPSLALWLLWSILSGGRGGGGGGSRGGGSFRGGGGRSGGGGASGSW